MQQENVLTELYTHTTTNAPDVPSAKCTRQFLEACNLIFERGLLHHGGPSNMKY